MRSYLIIGMCLLFLVQYFAQIEWLQYIVVLLALAAFLGSATKADRFPSILGILMMSIGIIIELSKGTGVAGINEGIFLILPLLSLITFAPLLSIPLKMGGYFQVVSRLLFNFLHKPKKLYAGITGSLFLLSPILNLGSVRIINEFLEDLKLPPAMSAKSYIVGFTNSMLWSPYFASVSLVLFYLNVPFTEYVMYGIGLPILSLLIGNLLFALWDKRHPVNIEKITVVPLQKHQIKKLMQLVFFVLILLITSLIIERITGWSMIVIVCLLSLIVPFLYTVASKNRKGVFPLIADFRDRSVPMMNNEIMLFMSAGMLAYALKGTTVMDGVSRFLNSLASQSFFLFALAVLLIVFCLSYIGIHQIAIVGALAMQLNAAELGISSVALALILLVSWSTSAALSPFSGLNLMVSKFAKLSGVQVGLRVNGLYLLTVVFISIAIISFL